MGEREVDIRVKPIKTAFLTLDKGAHGCTLPLGSRCELVGC